MTQMIIHFWTQGDYLALIGICAGLAAPVVYAATIINATRREGGGH